MAWENARHGIAKFVTLLWHQKMHVMALTNSLLRYGTRNGRHSIGKFVTLLWHNKMHVMSLTNLLLCYGTRKCTSWHSQIRYFAMAPENRHYGIAKFVTSLFWVLAKCQSFDCFYSMPCYQKIRVMA